MPLAMHLLFPRAVLAKCFARNMQPFRFNLYNISNCSSSCIDTLKYVKRSSVDAKLNRALRCNMSAFINSMFENKEIRQEHDEENDFVFLGKFMEGYSD